MQRFVHQYVKRKTKSVETERLVGDPVIHLLYSRIRENAPFLFNQLVSKRASSLLGFLNYDLNHWRFTNQRLAKAGPGREDKPVFAVRAFKDLDINPEEIWGQVEDFDTYRKIFERQIRYWEFRPMPDDPCCVVSPADARVLTGSFPTQKMLFIKETFFFYNELIGPDKAQWLKVFSQGDYAIFRLTPDKYHYNHAPVSGQVVDTYEIDGTYHSCNPGAVVQSVTPFSKNRRTVTIIDTDVDRGTRVGRVAMVEIVAMMIGRIDQCYSVERYDFPKPLKTGSFVQKGQPKSLFAPGSSTTVLIFEKNRIQFSQDLLANQNRSDVKSRFTRGFERPLVETDLNVRETIGEAI
ncbi:Phosphatidylserine decarboxylase [Desulforapulum autotrophicum HRM2]|uniref:Phosphatidylserine decarboxylase n=1 Tax=Desulforapulum autotrophicum (strain ATCC 43914 / DSM 3382 / VKM B-1955 / HRM2) TaxID=177437 RepID=C0QF59_DESAH|nr:phosphatidylserine decarboxylase [Desulforapulum autotrophicum]ACN17560.1 Phosphatidylserine decarboxylase [Desulforapulum autotrophicum HRM2]